MYLYSSYLSSQAPTHELFNPIKPKTDAGLQLSSLGLVSSQGQVCFKVYQTAHLQSPACSGMRGTSVIRTGL